MTLKGRDGYNHNEPKWQEPVEYILIGFALGVIFTIFIYGGYLL